MIHAFQPGAFQGNAFQIDPVSGSITAVEAADTASIAGKIIVSGAIAATEAKDTLASTGTVTGGGGGTVTGSLVASEAIDTAYIAGWVNQFITGGGHRAIRKIRWGNVAASEAGDSANIEGFAFDKAEVDIRADVVEAIAQATQVKLIKERNDRRRRDESALLMLLP